MLGEEGRRRKVEKGERSDGESDWRAKHAEQANRNPNDVSFDLLPNLWLSQLLEKHNQVLVKSTQIKILGAVLLTLVIAQI